MTAAEVLYRNNNYNKNNNNYNNDNINNNNSIHDDYE